VLARIEQIAAQRRVQIHLNKVMQATAAPCSAGMQARWARSIARVTGQSEVRRLPSGAGHDAMKLATLCEIGMLFVRCGNGGISHHPDESLLAQDAALAATAFEDFLLHFQDPT
jgi:allantoate deiminase/N-carbamoyl-L-amino-acid hydrolase